jgi:hypothetical protein
MTTATASYAQRRRAVVARADARPVGRRRAVRAGGGARRCLNDRGSGAYDWQARQAEKRRERTNASRSTDEDADAAYGCLLELPDPDGRSVPPPPPFRYICRFGGRLHSTDRD